MPQDLLTTRLDSLHDTDLKSLIVGGLRLGERRVSGLSRPELVALCSSELRSAAGFSTVNLVKRRGDQVFPYKQLLIDVADRLAPGSTPLSWTKYRLRDSSSEEDIENHVLELFEERVRGWWAKLPDKKREKYVNGINSVLSDAQEGAQAVKKRATPILQQQGIESLIQTGLISGLSKLSAGGLLGVAGVTLVGQMGWLILVQTVGWMAGLKIAVFGIGGYGAFGGAVTLLGSTAVGAVIALPGLAILVDGPAYRKTVPTTVMLVAKTRLNNLSGGPEAG